MKRFLLYKVYIFVVVVLLVILAWPFAVQRRVWPLVGFVIFAMADVVAELAFISTGALLGHWNWIGKAAGIAWGLLGILLFKLTRGEVGLVLPKTRRAWVLRCLASSQPVCSNSLTRL